MIHFLDDLYSYNDWANGKVLALCDGLTDGQLDQPREMGFGSLRATLFHILAADEMWWERWQGKPWRPFPTDPQGITLPQICDRLCEIAQTRCEYIQGHREKLWEMRIQYKDSQQVDYDHMLGDLLLHVFNHGTHHRAQALSFLKSFDRTAGMGIDYIFYRTETGATPQSEAGIEMLATAGMQVGSVSGHDVRWDGHAMKRWFLYNDWARNQVFDFVADVQESQLQDDFKMGPRGTILGTLQHLYDAEYWMFNSVATRENHFGTISNIESVSELRKRGDELANQRNEFLTTVDDSMAQEIFVINFGGPDLQYRVAEGLGQIVNHGVHHRAQLINMLRHSDAPIANIDMLYALDQPAMAESE